MQTFKNILRWLLAVVLGRAALGSMQPSSRCPFGMTITTHFS